MTLIADSGSTKTSWAVVESGVKIVTEGLNPHFTTDQQFIESFETVKRELSIEKGCQIVFYGSGCGNSIQKKRVLKLLQNQFVTDNANVETDMLGACRATAGENPGIVSILGTGSNACYYDGKKIVHQIFSTGYILGDEGSANHVGRMLLKAYLTDDMPDAISAMFHQCFPLSKHEMIEKLYSDPHANRWLASMARFVTERQKNKFCQDLLNSCIHKWIEEQIVPLSKATSCGKIYIVGGFGDNIKSLIKNCCKTVLFLDAKLVVKKVVANPIDGLLAYHRES